MPTDNFDDLANQLEQSLIDVETESSPDESDDSLTELIEQTRTAFTQLQNVFESAESFDDVTTAAENLWDVLDEGEDVLASLDTQEFLKTVDLTELPDVIELSNVPDAIERGKLRKALDLKALIQAINFREYWNSEEMQQLWKESQEFTDEVDDLTDDDSTNTAHALTDADDDTSELAAEATEGKLQSELMDNVEQFREQIKQARERLRTQIEESELGSGDTQESSTGYSTMTNNRPDIAAPIRHSTMSKRE
jgi:hypothetical protein